MRKRAAGYEPDEEGSVEAAGHVPEEEEDEEVEEVAKWKKPKAHTNTFVRNALKLKVYFFTLQKIEQAVQTLKG